MEEIFQVPILGDSSIGKTALLTRLVYNRFDDQTSPSIGGTNFTITLDGSGKPHKVTLVDTAGSEKYNSLTKSYIKQADIVVLCFESDNIKSLQNLKSWYDFAIDAVKEKTPRFVYVKTKVDFMDGLIPEEAITEVLNGLGANEYTSTSSQNGTGINELKAKLYQIASELKPPEKIGIQITNENEQPDGNNGKLMGCC